MEQTNQFHKIQMNVMLAIFCLLLISIGLQAQEKLYWVSGGPDAVMRSNLDGSDVEIIIDTLGDPTGLAIDNENEFLYIGLAGESDSVVRVNFDGTGVETLITTESGVSGIVLDSENGKIYYSLFGAGKIKRADLDGNNIETIVDPINSPGDFNIDFAAGKIYWTEYFEGNLNKCNLDGTEVETIISGQMYPSHLFLDYSNSKIFWTNYVGNNINSVNFDGTDHQVVMSSLSYPAGITLDIANTHIYWVNYQTKTIQRANTDGTNTIAIYTSTEPDIVMWTLKSTIQNTNSAEDQNINLPEISAWNYPNPFNPSTTISFNISREDTKNAKLEIFNLKGQMIKELQVTLSGVEGSATWNGTDGNDNPVSSGTYFYRLAFGKQSVTKKMVLIK
jgi:hypothetical protein